MITSSFPPVPRGARDCSRYFTGIKVEGMITRDRSVKQLVNDN
jgi:hypothetical protein